MTGYLLLAGLLGVGVLAYFVRKSGADAVKAQQGADNVKAAENIANSVAQSPTTHSELLDELQHGGKL